MLFFFKNIIVKNLLAWAELPSPDWSGGPVLLQPVFEVVQGSVVSGKVEAGLVVAAAVRRLGLSGN